MEKEISIRKENDFAARTTVCKIAAATTPRSSAEPNRKAKQRFPCMQTVVTKIISFFIFF